VGARAQVPDRGQRGAAGGCAVPHARRRAQAGPDAQHPGRERAAAAGGPRAPGRAMAPASRLAPRGLVSSTCGWPAAVGRNEWCRALIGSGYGHAQARSAGRLLARTDEPRRRRGSSLRRWSACARAPTSCRAGSWRRCCRTSWAPTGAPRWPRSRTSRWPPRPSARRAPCARAARAGAAAAPGRLAARRGGEALLLERG
jgi:hypothetical protein